MAFAENEVAFSGRQVAGHDVIPSYKYNICNACADKMAKWAEEHKAASDAKWEQKAPTKIDVSF